MVMAHPPAAGWRALSQALPAPRRRTRRPNISTGPIGNVLATAIRPAPKHAFTCTDRRCAILGLNQMDLRIQLGEPQAGSPNHRNQLDSPVRQRGDAEQ
jgi:hypothetical protein